jgi:C4-dicarboxylate-specific signal transduction histidine kinase
VLTGTAAERLIAWRCVVVRDADGHFTSVLCSGDDITESRRTDQEMRETQERMMHVARLATLGELASGISHELNQPLAAIATYAQAARRLVAMPEADPADVREALQEIADQALRAGEIIRRVRALARRQVGSREPCDLNEVVTDLLPLIQAEARASDVRVQLQLPAGLPQVNVDRIQIQQVLLNLVRNAIEALQANAVGERAVTLRTCSTPSGEVQLAVTDNGPGFTEQMRGQIFVPFITSKDNGTGLGLAISRSIVESHRGRLEYQPAEPHGASLLLTLPAS